MEYIYAALLLNEAKKEINEENLNKIIEAAGLKVDEAKAKAIVEALKGVIDKVLAKAYAQALALKNAAKIDA